MSPTSKGEVEIRDRFLLGIWEDIKADFNSEVINGNPYTASRYVYNLAIEIGSLFFGAENVEWTSKIFEGNDGLRERVFANIEMSRLARESSNYSDFAKFEKKFATECLSNPEAHNVVKYAKLKEEYLVTEYANGVVDSLKSTGKLPNDYIPKEETKILDIE